MAGTRSRTRAVLFSAAVAAALGFGAHSALASSPGSAQVTCTWKTATQAGCYNSCSTRGLYYYFWYPNTQQCCCSPVPR
jgi:hypothetical protein